MGDTETSMHMPILDEAIGGLPRRIAARSIVVGLAVVYVAVFVACYV